MKELIFEWVTFSIAVLGAVLGVVNFLIDIRRHRPVLKVSTRWIFLYYGGSQGDFAWGLAVKIMNVGSTDVIVRQIGAEHKDGGFVGVNPIPVEGWCKPDLIKPGDAAVVRIPRETFSSCPAEKVGRLFVELPSEQKFYAGVIGDFVSYFHSCPDNDFKEAPFSTRMTILAPENASDADKRKIEQNAHHYCRDC